MSAETSQPLSNLLAESVAWQQRLMAEASRSLAAARSFERMQASARAVEAAWRAALEPVLAMQRSMDRFAAPLRAIHAEAERMRRLFQELPGRLQRALLKIGKEGWYLDPHMPITAIWELERALDKGSTTDVAQALEEYFQSQLDHIESRLAASFPERGPVIAKVIAAHQRGDYELSIPVCLAQADGICLTATRIRLFSRKGGRPRTARLAKKASDGSTGRALLALLEAPLPITASGDDADFTASALNRHSVLHGVSLDYATRQNSLKALSLLNYVGHVFDPKSAKPGVRPNPAAAAGGRSRGTRR